MRLLTVLISMLLAPAAGAQAPLAAGPRVQALQLPVRGITISTHGNGRDWGRDNIVPTMKSIRDLGATWVATHPYARIRADGSVRFEEFHSDEPLEHLVRPIREAHALGLKIMIKPHLAYWGSPFSWRGEIAFDSEAKWQRFWRDYRRWIVALARACRDADVFVVGTELDRTLTYEKRWRELIEGVRDLTEAPLTYAANWTDYTQVRFWDALDMVGIQAYFPLVGERDPTVDVLRSAWAARMTDLRQFAEKTERDIVFTELGYNRSHLAPVEPWQSRMDGEDALPIQLACMRAALRAVEQEQRVVGVFLWKWFPAPNRWGGNFRLDTPEMKEVLRESWKDR